GAGMRGNWNGLVDGRACWKRGVREFIPGRSAGAAFGSNVRPGDLTWAGVEQPLPFLADQPGLVRHGRAAFAVLFADDAAGAELSRDGLAAGALSGHHSNSTSLCVLSNRDALNASHAKQYSHLLRAADGGYPGLADLWGR